MNFVADESVDRQIVPPILHTSRHLKVDTEPGNHVTVSIPKGLELHRVWCYS